MPEVPVGDRWDERMRIVGVDPSSKKIALFIWRDDEWEAATITTKIQDRAKALAELQKDLEEYLLNLESDETYFFVEQPLMGRGGAHATIVVSQVQGIVMACSVECGSDSTYPVNVQTWKKVIIGRGNVGKPEVREWLGAHESDLAEMAGGDQDLVDAACIALYGREIITRSERIGEVGMAGES